MFQKRGEEDYFVLVDFDLAADLAEKNSKHKSRGGPLPRHRTGTLRFKAFELVEDMHVTQIAQFMKQERKAEDIAVHCVRHDFESVLWVCLWSMIQTQAQSSNSIDDTEVDIRAAFLAQWDTGSYAAIADAKHILLSNPFRFAELPITPRFEGLRDWIKAFREPFRQGLKAYGDWAAAARKKKSTHKKARKALRHYKSWCGNVTGDILLDSFKRFEEESGSGSHPATSDELDSDSSSDSESDSSDEEST